MNKSMEGFGGSGTKSLHTSIRASLERLQTEYIDLLFVNWWDPATSIPELMQSLNRLVTSGKVLYLGISNASVRCAFKDRKTATTDKCLTVGIVLEEIATRNGTELTSVALAYLMHKSPYVLPHC
ncbi:hypothetical protein N0V88_002864 [Collariella sp. IMI 366227]|nr:hypothetical protein N0V88_002864 [Collariella sp. IMI 366227]